MVKGGGEGGRGIELTVDILTRFVMSLFILFIFSLWYYYNRIIYPVLP